MQRYNPKDIEPKWQKIWDETGVYTTDLNTKRPKYLAMSMFNYPSGAGIHIGHAMNYTISDVKARFKRQQGYESYHPVGWDSFGLPAENYAIKTGVSPQESMATIIPGYHKQYKALGWSNDWEKEIATHLPEYYKWTQWIFTQMHKHGLAYQDSRMQWWCPIDNTVLANEQVIDGKCWRHDGPNDPPAEKREVKQWFFKITDYADELLDAIEGLDWTESVKLAQKNWIGKSTGAEVEFIVPRVVNPNPDMARTYIMGQRNIAAADIEAVGGHVERTTEKGYLCAEFPVAQAEAFEKMIVDKMEPGFWNEYLTNEQLVFIFKHKDGRVERFVLDDNNGQQICALGNQFNNLPAPGPEETPWSWLADNSWYAEVVPKITVFTTRPDTLFGATFLVVAPEHTIVDKITTPDRAAAVQAYKQAAAQKTDVQRQEAKQKTGEFTGAYAVNPVNGQKLPIWTADYVLVGYGTGAIMAVPAHDERDYEFAKQFDLPIKQVVAERIIDTGNPQRPGKELVPRQVVCMAVKHPTENKYLIACPTGGDSWSTIMGGIDDGESPEDAARRELLEESGYTDITSLSVADDVIAYEFFAKHKDQNRVAYTHAVAIQLESLDKQEISAEEQAAQQLKWATPEEIVQLRTGEQIMEPIHRAEGAVRDMVHEGRLINSGAYDGLPTEEAREKIIADLAAKGVASEKVNYRMRDWSVSRQRYWGAPIPIIHCPDCGPVLVPEDQLPVVLPELDDFAPSGDGRSALARAADWLKAKCPQCGGDAERETDTLDTYICSSWYFYRYMDPHNQQAAFDPALAKKWEPVDFYNGADHATAHLLYARFIGHFFKRLGLVDEPEPFKHFLFNGKITASDGTMFSKSKGTGVDPLDIIEQGYGADALRTFLMFAAPLELWAKWDPQGVPGTHRFLSRIWNLVGEYNEAEPVELTGDQQRDLRRAAHAMIRKMTEDIEADRYNTAIAASMTCVNELYRLKKAAFGQHEVWRESLAAVAACIAPFAPHTAEELWHQLGHSTSVHRDSWPQWNEEYLAADTVTVAVQVNGKLRGTVGVPAGSDEAATTAAAHGDAKIAANLDGRTIVKAIYVPGKLLNFVVK